MLPFTPRGKDNMIAWLAARSDGGNYGKLLLYKFPKERLIYGPSQFESRIDQDPTSSRHSSHSGVSAAPTSSAGTHWSSQLASRTSTLSRSISSLMRRRARSLSSSKSSFRPGSRLVMEPTLEAAISRLFGLAAPSQTTPAVTTLAPGNALDPTTIRRPAS